MYQGLRQKRGISQLEAAEFIECTYGVMHQLECPTPVEPSKYGDDTVVNEFSQVFKVGKLAVRVILEERQENIGNAGSVNEQVNAVVQVNRPHNIITEDIKTRTEQWYQATRKTTESGDFYEVSYAENLFEWSSKRKSWRHIPTVKQEGVVKLGQQLNNGELTIREHDALVKTLEREHNEFMVFYDDDGIEDIFTVARLRDAKLLLDHIK